MEDASIQEVMQFRARWQREKRVMRSGKQASPHEDYLAHCPFTERERDAMIALPRKECP